MFLIRSSLPVRFPPDSLQRYQDLSFALPFWVKENVAVVRCALDAETAVMTVSHDNFGDHTRKDPSPTLEPLHYVLPY